jgi:hypothetical protein
VETARPSAASAGADADVHRSAASVQHPRARRDELSHLHVRVHLGRPARPAEGEPERHRGADPRDRAREAARSAGDRALRLLGSRRGDEEVRDDALRESQDLARPEARHGPHAPVRPHRTDHLDHPGNRDRCVLGVTPVLPLRLHCDDPELRRLRDTHPCSGSHSCCRCSSSRSTSSGESGSSTRRVFRRLSTRVTACTSSSTAPSISRCR